MAETIPYSFPAELHGAQKCVFKLSFGEDKKKYFIFKCLKLSPLVESFAAQIYREVVQPKKDSMFFKVAAYYRKYRPSMMYVELISKPNLTGIEVLIAENKALRQAENDSNCLNMGFDNTIREPSWITHAEMTAYRELLKGKTPADKLRKADTFLTKYVKTRAGKAKVISYIKRNFM